MQRNLILGIDPGLSGALALYNPYSKSIEAIHDMPIVKSNNHTEVSVYELANMIGINTAKIMFAMVELVGAMTYQDRSGKVRGQGAAASFSFGRSAGVIHGILASNMIVQYSVHPSVWKSGLGLSSSKKDSLDKAKSLFPNDHRYFQLKKNEGRAEALLLAVFAARQLKT